MSRTIRFLVHAAFIYTCVEGLVVNLTYPNVIAYIVKDVMILMMYAALLTESRPSSGSLKKIGGAVLAFTLLILFFMLLPTPVSLVAALVAVKQRLFYIPLMYVAYFYTRTERDVYGLIKLMAWTAIPTALFGIYLFFAGPAALRAMGGSYSAIFYTTMGASGITFWRVPGPFTSPGQYSLYLLMQVVLLTGVLFVPTVERRTRLLAIVALLVSLAAMLVSGSRTPLVIYVLCVGLGLFYLGRLGRVGIAALVVYAMMAVAFTYFGAGVQDRVGSVLSQENIDRFQRTAFGQVFYERMMSSPLGLGIGIATIAGRHFTDFTKLVFVESYFGVMAVETGILGLAVTIWLMIRTAHLLIRDRVLVRSAPWSPVWFFIVLLILAIIGFMPSSTMIDSAPGNMYFWFLIGMAVRLADLQRAKLSAPAVAQAEPAALMTPQFAFEAPRSTTP